MRTAHLLLLAQLAAYWPVWRWYVARVTDTSDEPFGLVALGTALVFLVGYGKPKALTRGPLLLASLLVVVYVVTFPIAPPLARAVLALTALSCTLSSYCLGRALHLGILGLLLLSLPLIASLQFYAGYPVRAVTAQLSAQLIQLTGFAVTAEGTWLNWLGEVIAVDAPCAGIRMLWTGLYLTFTLACFTRLGPRATWVAYSLSTAVIFVGNLLRTTVLFYREAGIVTFPQWMHAGLGVAVFTGVALVLVSINTFVKRRIGQCAW